LAPDNHIGFKVGNGATPAHTLWMERDPTYVAILRWLAAVGTILIALLVWYVAHDDFGFSQQEIQTVALLGAAVIGALLV
jgi:hypothetical protein